MGAPEGPGGPSMGAPEGPGGPGFNGRTRAHTGAQGRRLVWSTVAAHTRPVARLPPPIAAHVRP